VYKDYQTYLKIMDTQKPKNVLATRTATQLGFANLFKELCDLMSVECVVLDGFYKMFSETPTKFKLYDFVKHNWLCITHQNQKYMIDVF